MTDTAPGTGTPTSTPSSTSPGTPGSAAMDGLATPVIAPDVTRLIQLFSAQPELRFADLDGRILHEAAAKVKERHQALLEAEAALAAALAALDEEQEALLRHAHRAHAYLRVYAESEPALLERVEAISLPRGRRAARAEAASDGAPTPPRKPRSRRATSAEAGLFPPAEAASAP